jgi:sulfite reductase (NADPH) hemoprotein beta-component
VLGVDKDGAEWYQVEIGGSQGAHASLGKVLGRAFAADEVPDVIEAVLDTYKALRQPAQGRHEYFIETLHRVGQDPFKAAANAARHPAADAQTA